MSGTRWQVWRASTINNGERLITHWSVERAQCRQGLVGGGTCIVLASAAAICSAGSLVTFVLSGNADAPRRADDGIVTDDSDEQP